MIKRKNLIDMHACAKKNLFLFLNFITTAIRFLKHYLIVVIRFSKKTPFFLKKMTFCWKANSVHINLIKSYDF